MLRLFQQYYPIRNVFFVIGEFLVIYGSTLLANLILFDSLDRIQSVWLQLKILLITIICQACLYYNDLYDLKVTDTFSELSIRLLQALGATAIILAGIYALMPSASMGLEVFIVSICFDILFIVSWRFGYAVILNGRVFDQKIALMGSGDLSRSIFQEISERKDCGYIVSGVILEGNDSNDTRMRRLVAQKKDAVIVGFMDEEDLCTLLKKMNIDKVVVGVFRNRALLPVDELLRCRVNGIEVLDGNSFYEMLTGKLIVDHIDPEWLIFSKGFHKSASKRMLKRAIDLSLSVAMLICLMPLIGLVALVIKLDTREPPIQPADLWRYFGKKCKKEGVAVPERLLELISAFLSKGAVPPPAAGKIWDVFKRVCQENGTHYALKLNELMKAYVDATEPQPSPRYPVFFSQERVGKNGQAYRVHKFRSMIVNAERYSGPVWAGEDDPRITRIGNILRKTRIDEIPQLWNVMKGEMSFVGPRPERAHFVRQLEKKIPYYRERLTVKPGLTGWAQVCYGYGANEDDAKEKLNYDLFYIKNLSIPMDLMIVLRTVKIVLFGKGR